MTDLKTGDFAQNNKPTGSDQTPPSDHDPLAAMTTPDKSRSPASPSESKVSEVRLTRVSQEPLIAETPLSKLDRGDQTNQPEMATAAKSGLAQRPSPAAQTTDTRKSQRTTVQAKAKPAGGPGKDLKVAQHLQITKVGPSVSDGLGPYCEQFCVQFFPAGRPGQKRHSRQAGERPAAHRDGTPPLRRQRRGP